MTFSLKMYTEYGAPALGRGTSVESADVNWKTNQDPSLMYIYYPVKRPLPHWSYLQDGWDYGNSAEIATSVSINNYFRITGVTGKIVEPKIIVCSPHLTKIKVITQQDVDSGTWNPLILYAGSAWATGLEYHKDVGVVATRNKQGEDLSYAKFVPLGEKEVDGKTILPNPALISTLDTIYANNIAGEGPDQSLFITETGKEYTASNDVTISSYAGEWTTIANQLAAKHALLLIDHLFISDKVCFRINKLTGSADKVRYCPSKTWAENETLASATGSDIGTETTSAYHELSAKSTYLFAGLSNTYFEPTSAMINNLRFVSNGNLTIPVALSSSPLIAGPKQDEYTGADLYSPYIVSQLRLAAAKYDDVGNSPQYRILFSCKVYN